MVIFENKYVVCFKELTKHNGVVNLLLQAWNYNTNRNNRLLLKPGPRPWTRTVKNLDPEKPGLRKTWSLKNLDPEKPGP